MFNRDNLSVGMVVEVKGKYDLRSSKVRIAELGEGLNFTHETLDRPKIISCHKYEDIIRVIGGETMECTNTYHISEKEVREIIAKHIYTKTELEVQPKAEDIKFNIRYSDRGGTYLSGVYFTLNESIKFDGTQEMADMFGMDVDDYEEGDIIDDTGIDPQYCPFCNGHKAHNDELLRYTLKLLDRTYDDVLKEYINNHNKNKVMEEVE